MSTDIETATAFFCVTILVIFAYVLFATADMKSPEEKAWDELNSIGTGVFEEGTLGGKYTFDASVDATKIEITVNEYKNVVIKILKGAAAGRTLIVLRWVATKGAIFFDLAGRKYKNRLGELTLGKSTFWVFYN